MVGIFGQEIDNMLIDLLTASGEAYTGEGDYGDLETRDAGEWDDFDFDWG